MSKGNKRMSIYLDNAATTKPCEPAVSAVFVNMVEDFGNPSSLHKIGLQAESNITDARKAIAAALVCDPQCVIFTSGATESNNMAVFGAVENYGRRKKKIVISGIEHPSVAEPVKYLEEHDGYEVVRVSPNHNGQIDEDVFCSAVDNNTCFVSCMLVNNETGSVQPVKKIFSYVKRNYPECITHCDAVQGFLKLPIKTSELYADIITVSAHKVHAVKGVGAMYIKKGIRVAPLIYGGGQERGLRSGTESVPLIAGFGAAVRALLPTMNTAYNNAEIINTYLLKKLSKLDFVTVNSNAEITSPYITNFSVPGIRSEIMLHYLEGKDIYVSSGSACSKGAHSSVLKSMGLTDRIADSAIRVSISRTTTMGEIDLLINALQEGYLSLAKIK
jgi:cysteine desulfurase